MVKKPSQIQELGRVMVNSKEIWICSKKKLLFQRQNNLIFFGTVESDWENYKQLCGNAIEIIHNVMCVDFPESDLSYERGIGNVSKTPHPVTEPFTCI